MGRGPRQSPTLRSVRAAAVVELDELDELDELGELGELELELDVLVELLELDADDDASVCVDGALTLGPSSLLQAASATNAVAATAAAMRC